MDSKRKYLRNRHWKRKYDSSHSTAGIKKPLENQNYLAQNTEDSDSLPELTQPIPKDGWFPKYISSPNDFQDFESLTTVSRLPSISSCKAQIKNDNWFDKELEGIQLHSKDEVNKTIIDENKKDANVMAAVFCKTSHQLCDYKDKSHMKKYIIEQKSTKVDSEEELEFLLSLKEPVYAGPLITEKNYENGRRLSVLNNKYMEQRPIKSIDLEKWLDSVLDD